VSSTALCEGTSACIGGVALSDRVHCAASVAPDRCLVAVIAAGDAQRRAAQKTGGGQHADAGGASIVPAQKW
jgi:hypothetical protein